MDSEEPDFSDEDVADMDALWDQMDETERTASMAKWTAAKREKHPEADFGEPSKRAFPISDQEDIEHAAELLHHAGDPAAVKKRLVAIARRKGLKLPASWQKNATMGEAVAFDLGSGGLDGEEVVYQDALLFRCGDYPDKEFSLSEEEADAAVNLFSPVPNELQHINSQFGEATILDGKLGEIRDVWRDGDEVRGEVAIPAWLDRIWEGAKRVSAVWDRETKTLAGLGLVVKGRVPDAALMAAFAVAHPSDAEAIFSSAGATAHGQGAIQMIHDHAARSGAVCSAASSPSSGFTAPRERRGLQKIHDMAVTHGAKCSIGGGRSALYSQRPKEGLMPSLVKKFRSLFGKSLPEETDDDQVNEFLGDLAVTFAKPPKGKPKMEDDEESEDDDDEDEDEPTPPPKKGKKKPAAMAAASADRSETARLREEVEALREENLLAKSQSAAVSFADSVKDRILPTERENLITIYSQALVDDHRSKIVVTFSDVAGKAKTGGRVDSIRATYMRRPPITALFNEYITADQIPDGSVVMFNREEAAARNKKEAGFSDDDKGKKALEAELSLYGNIGQQAIKLRKNGTA